MENSTKNTKTSPDEGKKSIHRFVRMKGSGFELIEWFKHSDGTKSFTITQHQPTPEQLKAIANSAYQSLILPKQAC